MENPEATIENIITIGSCYLAKKEGRHYVLRHESFDFITKFIAVHRNDGENIAEWLEANRPFPKNDTALTIFAAIHNATYATPQAYAEHIYHTYVRHNANLTEMQKEMLREWLYEIGLFDAIVASSYLIY